MSQFFAVFPEKLVEMCLLASTKEGDFVLDPFAGSGTTGVVAKKNNRNFIGVELVKKYQRIHHLYPKDSLQSRLF